jgi:hypothetical protein
VLFSEYYLGDQIKEGEVGGKMRNVNEVLVRYGEISGSHGNKFEDGCLLVYCGM